MYNSDNNLKPSNNKELQISLIFFICITIFIFVVLIIRIGYIQILKNTNYEEQSKNNRVKIERIEPIRGSIVTADDKQVALNKKIFNVYIDRRMLNKNAVNRQKALLYLAKTLEIEYIDIERMIQKNSDYNRITIAENIEFTQFTKLHENLENLDGIYTEEKYIRFYPNNNTLSHVLGFTGIINASELAKLKDNGYTHLDYIGKNGIEKTYENYLKGKPGLKYYEIDAKMNVHKEIKEKNIDPEPGKEVQLSIDLTFQKNVEDILADRAGTIVVMRPANGEILAMASYPNYDPNIYILPTQENIEMIRKMDLDTKGTPLINRAVQTVYPPASTFKIISSMIVLEENIVSPYQKYFCGGSYRLNHETFGCWSTHGHQNLEEAIVNSCNVYFFNVSQKIGVDKIAEYSNRFGFNGRTGIDLPSERNGNIPTLQWAKESGRSWFLGNTIQVSVGQGDVETTPIQLAVYASALANRGYGYKPRIVKSINDSVTGEVLFETEKEKIVDAGEISAGTYNFIQSAMRKVVTKGTARWAFNNNDLKIAGKTGTAEAGIKANKEAHSLFIGYGPIDYPQEEQIVVVVVIEYANDDPLKYAATIASLVYNSKFRNETFEESAKRLWYPVKDSYNE